MSERRRGTRARRRSTGTQAIRPTGRRRDTRQFRVLPGGSSRGRGQRLPADFRELLRRLDQVPADVLMAVIAGAREADRFWAAVELRLRTRDRLGRNGERASA